MLKLKTTISVAIALVLLVDLGTCQTLAPDDKATAIYGQVEVIGEVSPSIFLSLTEFFNEILVIIESFFDTSEGLLNGADSIVNELLNGLPLVVSTPLSYVFHVMLELLLLIINLLKNLVNDFYGIVNEFLAWIIRVEKKGMCCYNRSEQDVLRELVGSLTVCVSSNLYGQIQNLDKILDNVYLLVENIRLGIIEIQLQGDIVGSVDLVIDMITEEVATFLDTLLTVAGEGLGVGELVPELTICVTEALALSTPAEILEMVVTYFTCFLG